MNSNITLLDNDKKKVDIWYQLLFWKTMKIFNCFCIGILMKTSVMIFLFPDLKCFIILTLREVNLLLDTGYCYSVPVTRYLLLLVTQ